MREATLEEYRILSAVIRHIREVADDIWENPATNQALQCRWKYELCSIQCQLDFIKAEHQNTLVLSTSGWTFQLNNKMQNHRFGSMLVHQTDERLELELIALKMAV